MDFHDFYATHKNSSILKKTKMRDNEQDAYDTYNNNKYQWIKKKV